MWGRLRQRPSAGIWKGGRKTRPQQVEGPGCRPRLQGNITANGLEGSWVERFEAKWAESGAGRENRGSQVGQTQDHRDHQQKPRPFDKQGGSLQKPAWCPDRVRWRPIPTPPEKGLAGTQARPGPGLPGGRFICWAAHPGAGARTPPRRGRGGMQAGSPLCHRQGPKGVRAQGEAPRQRCLSLSSLPRSMRARWAV